MKSTIHLLTLVFVLLLIDFQVNAQGQLRGTTRKGGATGGGTIFQTNADASNYYEVKKEWVLDTPGAFPQSNLIEVNGKLFGMTPSGGAYNLGVLFEYKFGTGYKVWHHFTPNEGNTPQGGLVAASNGKLYGTTFYGGTNFQGALFEFDPATGAFSEKIQWSSTIGSGSRSSMMAATNGKLYGLTGSGGSVGYGVLFEYDPATASYSIKYNFDSTTGSFPRATPLQATNGKLYGTTQNGGANGKGVVFEYNLTSGTFAKLYDFTTASGSNPTGTLTQAANGKIYGTCTAGGASEGGAIFEFDLATSQYTMKYDFSGATLGTRPFNGLTEASNGKLYTLTSSGGPNTPAKLIEYDPASATTVNRYSLPFLNGAGGYAYASMLRIGNTLYGVLPLGGETGAGTMFSYNPLSDNFSKVMDFSYGSEGALPHGGMTLAGNGKMYGMVSSGGSSRVGLLYEFDPVTNNYATKVEFTGTNGGTPLGEMIAASNGKLYGTTTFGGTLHSPVLFINEDFTQRLGDGLGILFEYDPATNSYIKKAEFDGTNGSNPYGRLMEASDGKLYGVTNSGGASGDGTIFKYDISTGQITKLKDLPASGGGTVAPGPRAGLVEAPNGKFYGTTSYGGTNGGGRIYEYNPSTGDLTIVFNFTAPSDVSATSTGAIPKGELTLGADGKLYGLTTSGGSGNNLAYAGTIFQVDPSTLQFTLKKVLSANEGLAPKGSFTIDESGKMYALCYFGPYGNIGTIFQYDPSTNIVTGKLEFKRPGSDNPLYTTLALYPGKMEQRIALDAAVSKAYKSGNSTLPANSSAGLPITYTSSNTAVATVSGNVVTVVSVGTTTIKGVQAGTTSYNAAPDATQSLTVIKSDQTMSLLPPVDHKMSEVYLSLYAYVSSGLTPTFTSSDPSVASINTNGVLIFNKVGTTTITAKQPGNDFYNAAADVSSLLTIVIGDQAITFPEFSPYYVNSSPFTVNASVSSGLPLTFTSSNPAVATVSGNQVTVIGEGTTNIKATQAGNSNFHTAQDVTRTLTISKRDQTITFFPTAASYTLGAAPFSLSGSTTSELPIQYTTTSDKITLSGDKVTLVKAGSVAVAANQSGNTIYKAAVRVERTFCVNPARPAITLSGENTENILLTSSATEGNQWFLNGTAIASATQTTIKPSTPGLYTVKATVDNCSSDISNEVPLIITGDISSVNTAVIRAFPNPVTDHLVVELSGSHVVHTIHVLRMDGTVIEHMETASERIEVDVSRFAAGIYLLRVNNAAGTYSQKFFKK